MTQDNHNDPRESGKRRNLLLKIINIAIVTGFGIFLVFFLLRQVSFSEIKAALSNVYRISLAAAFVTVIIGNFFRAYRKQLLVGKEKIRLVDMLFIEMIKNAFTMVLPARTGEISYVYILTRKFRFPVEIGISTLIIVMVFDLAIVFFLIVIGIIVVWITRGFETLSFSSCP